MKNKYLKIVFLKKNLLKILFEGAGTPSGSYGADKWILQRPKHKGWVDPKIPVLARGFHKSQIFKKS